MTLELREWCERIVVDFCKRQGVDEAPKSDVVKLVLYRKVAERRIGDTDRDDFKGAASKVVLAPPKLLPRRLLRRESQVTWVGVLPNDSFLAGVVGNDSSALDSPFRFTFDDALSRELVTTLFVAPLLATTAATIEMLLLACDDATLVPKFGILSIV